MNLFTSLFTKVVYKFVYLFTNSERVTDVTMILIIKGDDKR